MNRALTAAVAAAFSAGLQAQPLKVTGHNVRFDPGQQAVTFEIEFDRRPDFFTLDPAGRQADSWQINLDTTPGHNGFGGTSPYPWEIIVRGEEIHLDDDIRVRDHVLGPSPDPTSGGWGPLTGAVPYSIIGGKRQRFTIPFNLLNTQSGTFRFELETFHYGQLQPDVIKGGSIPAVPAPAAAGVLGAGGMLMFCRRR